MGWSLLYLVALVPILLFLASLLGRYFLLCELLCNFRAYILIMLLITGPALFWLKRKWLAIAWVGAVVWSMAGTVTVFLPTTHAAVSSDATLGKRPSPTIKIMSFNVLGHNWQHDEVVAEIRQHDPDILVVEEYTNNWPYAFENLHSVYPHRLEEARWHGFGIAIFSKLPLENKFVSQLDNQRTDSPLVMATLKIGERQLRIAGVHLFSPTDNLRLDIRNQQIRELGQILSPAAEPTILLGDFNCVPWSPFLSDFLAQTGYRDSRQGFGYDGTWYAKKIFLRIPIDHAFVSPQVNVHSRAVGQSAGSDHFPIIVEVSVD